MTSVPFNGGDAVTMISLELVDFINSHRAEGAPTLAHSDFLKKVPRVLKKDAGKFSHIYLDSLNRRQKCYRLPKRECCLMAMSYSYDLQAAVFDHMTELELRLAQRTAFPIPRTRADALRLAADLDEQNARLVMENKNLKLRLQYPEPTFQAGLTPVQFSRTLNGVNSQKINHFLLEIRLDLRRRN
jgi:phage regulator Rha-like protein